MRNDINLYQVGEEYEILTLPVGQRIPVPADQTITYPSGRTLKVTTKDTFQFDWEGFKGDLPLLNQYARDEEFEALLPTVPHTHVDWRFVETKFYKKFKRTHAPVYGEIFILHGEATAHHAKMFVKRKEMTCLRQIAPNDWPDYTSPNVLPLIRVIEKIYKDKDIRKGLCPHAGTSVQAMVKSHCEQYLVCPAHGLRFSARTGKLAPYPRQLWE